MLFYVTIFIVFKSEIYFNEFISKALIFEQKIVSIPSSKSCKISKWREMYMKNVHHFGKKSIRISRVPIFKKSCPANMYVVYSNIYFLNASFFVKPENPQTMYLSPQCFSLFQNFFWFQNIHLFKARYKRWNFKQLLYV